MDVEQVIIIVGAVSITLLLVTIIMIIIASLLGVVLVLVFLQGQRDWMIEYILGVFVVEFLEHLDEIFIINEVLLIKVRLNQPYLYM